jgi:hypothetical protein
MYLLPKLIAVFSTKSAVLLNASQLLVFRSSEMGNGGSTEMERHFIILFAEIDYGRLHLREIN